MKDHLATTHVLLVEDDDGHAALILRAMRQGPLTASVERVTTVAAALAYLRRQGSHAAAERPSFVLLDLKLPGGSGHDLLDAVRKDQALCSIPIVILSTSAAERDRALASSLGASGYLVKPTGWSELQALLAEAKRRFAAPGGAP